MDNLQYKHVLAKYVLERFHAIVINQLETELVQFSFKYHEETQPFNAEILLQSGGLQITVWAYNRTAYISYWSMTSDEVIEYNDVYLNVENLFPLIDEVFNALAKSLKDRDSS